MEIQIRPPASEPTLRYLNACFPGWGDQQMFDWAFSRQMHGQPPTDYILLSEDGETLAGSGVSYREVLLPNDAAITVGIMTGSWTLPAARGRGFFSRMIEESIKITAARKGALLIAYVTADNPSCRALLKSGAAAFPTSYFSRQPEAGAVAASDETLAEVTNIPDQLIARWRQQYVGFARFGYQAADDWRSQFLYRPSRPRVLARNADEFAMIDEHGDTDRIVAYLGAQSKFPSGLLRAVFSRAASRGKKMFAFSSDADLSELCLASGFAERPGFLTVNVADWQLLASALRVKDQPPGNSNALVADPQSPWFIGTWRLQSGDRM
jgi:hypothetical protein